MSVPPRLADLVRKARRLAAERDRLIDALAVEWARALQGQRLSQADFDELWAGLTEDAVRRAGPAREGGSPSQAWRRETQEVVARIREKVEAILDER
jgi:hypothetical protein